MRRRRVSGSNGVGELECCKCRIGPRLFWLQICAGVPTRTLFFAENATLEEATHELPSSTLPDCAEYGYNETIYCSFGVRQTCLRPMPDTIDCPRHACARRTLRGIHRRMLGCTYAPGHNLRKDSLFAPHDSRIVLAGT